MSKYNYWGYKYLIDAEYENAVYDAYARPWNTDSAISNLKTSKEEKNMHKKVKFNGHVAHKLPKCDTLYYTVEPENGRICVWKLAYIDAWTREPNYEYYGYLNICARHLGCHGYLQDQISYLARKYSDNTALEHKKLVNDLANNWRNAVFKEEKKMGEIRKDRITLDESEDCCLELFRGSNTIVFHFGTESRVVTVPDDYEINYGVKETGTCDLQIVKKKPKLLNMKFTVEACPIFRQKYANVNDDTTICDSAIAFPEPYAGDPLRLVIKNGVVSCFESNDELREWIDDKVYTTNAVPLIERKIREAYNTRKIFPNATNGIEIIREDL